MSSSRKCWKLFPLLMAASAALLHATPTITSVSGCPNGPAESPQITGGITAGTGISSFPLCIYGSFAVGAVPSIVWHDLASGATASYGAANATIAPTYIEISVPKALFTSVAVAGQADPVTITVTEGTNAAVSSFPVNPPLASGGPAFAGTIGVPLTVTLYNFGTGPVFTDLISGTLPPGMGAFPSNSPTWSGTPTLAGTFTVTFIATDAWSNSATITETFNIASPSLAISTLSPLPSGVIGSLYATTLAATGGVPPYTWTAKGLPAGLALTGTTGVISGVPTQDGAFTVAVTVRDSNPTAVITASANFSLTIKPIPLVIVNASLANGTVGAAYTVVLSTTGGDAPITFSAAGLPPGLTLSAAGSLTGTPTTAGSYTVSVTATDVNGLAARAVYSVTIAPQLVITTTSVSGAVLGSSLSTKLAATGGTPPYSWVGSSLPAGLSLASDGTLSGTPSAPGTASFNATVIDSNGIFTTKALSVIVALPPGPGVTFSGIGATVAPQTQPSLSVTLGSTYPADITVNLTMTVVTDSGLTDPMFQFATGGLTFQTKAPAGSTGVLTAPAIQMGTDAATVTITAQLLAAGQDVTPSPAPKLSFRLNAAAPVITAISAARSGAGFTVTITGYATSRDVASANFQFSASSGANLQTTQLPLTLSSIFAPWYSSAASAQYGSQFTYTQPFTVTGNTSAILSVTVTLTNSVGTSPAASANLQ